ncbi:hypothetical protein CFP56_019992 [Quercus suber]|uniref:Uncharacterized protein n=1 Tax=Quercus suber TaxID=58331 RepID=A0AAW0KFV2_QUESU
MDPKMEGIYDKGKMEILVEMALLCLEENKYERSTMKQIESKLSAVAVCRDDTSEIIFHSVFHLILYTWRSPCISSSSDYGYEAQASIYDFDGDHKHRSAFFLSTYHVPEDNETSTNK